MIVSTKSNDCGVCALANALDVTWQDAKELIWPKGRKGKNYYTTTKNLIEAINRSNADIGSSPLCQTRLMPNTKRAWPKQGMYIVKVRPRGCKPHNWHWVACDGKKVYDNQYSKPIPIEEYRLKPYGYIEIE